METDADREEKRKKRRIFRFPKDGFSDDDLEETRIAAMSTAFLSLSEHALEELNAGELKYILIEGSDGFIMLSKNGENIMFQTLPEFNNSEYFK